MKKLTTVFVFIIIGLTLVACGGDEPKDIEVTVIDLNIESNEIIADVIVTETFKELKQLEEIAYNVSSQLYEENFEMIGASSYSLIINFYDSQGSFDAEDVSYGTIIFDVNKTMENPGLSLNQNQLSID
jgi:hypothetical protein